MCENRLAPIGANSNSTRGANRFLYAALCILSNQGLVYVKPLHIEFDLPLATRQSLSGLDGMTLLCISYLYVFCCIME